MAGYDKLTLEKVLAAYSRGVDILCDADRKIAFVRPRSK